MTHLRLFDEDTLALRLREIDNRLYESRDSLRVNQASHTPTPRGFVPSLCRLGEYQ